MPQPDVISALASTVMALIVATVALVFNYRQNVGWAPVAMVTDSALQGTGAIRHFLMRVRIEFWNRRKYPLALRLARADVTGVEILDVSPSGLGIRDFVQNNCAYRQPNVMVEPHTSKEVVFEVEFKDQSVDAMKPLFVIQIGYFDPRRQRVETMRLQHRFLYPGLGWQKTAEQREAILTMFEDLKVGEEERRTAILEKARGKEPAINLGQDESEEEKP